MMGLDATVVEVAMLSRESQKKYKKPWVVLFPDGTHLEFSTEGSASYSRYYYRREVGLEEKAHAKGAV